MEYKNFLLALLFSGTLLCLLVVFLYFYGVDNNIVCQDEYGDSFYMAISIHGKECIRYQQNNTYEPPLLVEEKPFPNSQQSGNDICLQLDGKTNE